MNKVRKPILIILAVMLLILPQVTGCDKLDGYTPVAGLDKNENVTLRIAIPYETNKAMNTISNTFMEKYPNVNVQMQYIEDYDTNVVQLFKDNELDVILQKDLRYEDENIILQQMKK